MSASSRLFGGVASANYNWKEVTRVFRDSADELVLGELLHDANFGLFEAMSAIEMMDPKMDAGMLCNQVYVCIYKALLLVATKRVCPSV